MTLDHTWPFNPAFYRGWSLQHHPASRLPDYWIATSPDFHYEDGGYEITGSFITAGTRMDLIDEIDRSMM